MKLNSTPTMWLEAHCFCKPLCLLLAVTLFLSSCGTTGPTAIRNGRLNYNEAILATDNQQMLLAVVKERYNERAELLMVSSVTANIRVATRAGLNLGIGDSDDYAGNLTPLSGGVLYEENPIITCSPINGQLYMNKLLGRISIENLALISSASRDPQNIYDILVSRVNSMRNHKHLEDPLHDEFDRFVALMSTMIKRQTMYWARDPGRENQLVIILDRSKPEDREAIRELMDLLDLAEVPTNRNSLIIPVYAGQNASGTGGLGIVTRSVRDLVGILAAAVELPEADVQRGVVADFSIEEVVDMKLRVRWSEEQPEYATVEVPYRGGWFYIDERDQYTKKYFRMMAVIWSAAIADSALSNPAPMLTVPVGR
jgi:hypothetical protein